MTCDESRLLGAPLLQKLWEMTARKLSKDPSGVRTAYFYLQSYFARLIFLLRKLHEILIILKSDGRDYKRETIYFFQISTANLKTNATFKFVLLPATLCRVQHQYQRLQPLKGLSAESSVALKQQPLTTSMSTKSPRFLNVLQAEEQISRMC